MNSKHSQPVDAFKAAREEGDVLRCPFQGESVPMILRHKDVRAAAKDWKTFSSDAPFKVPIPSEEDLRSVRQLPIEVNPPEHTEYRKLVDPFFKRSKTPEVTNLVENLIDGFLDKALGEDLIEVIRDFALPIQSKALTYLLNVPESEADRWISWGIHVFHDGSSKGSDLDTYLSEAFDKALQNPGDDFFSALSKATYQGRPLTRDEMMGFANLAFAGGRDTIIYTIASAIAYLAENKGVLAYLREDPKRIIHAAEELFRVYMPLTHIGRVCPVDTDVHGTEVPAGGRVSLCWSSANFDEEVFEGPDAVRLDRKPNPHLSFGFGTHLCLGAPHARLILRTLLSKCAERLSRIEITEATRHVENQATYQRLNGYDSLTVKFIA